MKTLLCLALSSALAFGQGTLTPPPGPPAPTMKTLNQIDAKLDPRTPISSLPFTVSQPGSYYLTGNLTGASGQDGITITASGVTLDLMGFELAGVAGSLSGVRFIGNGSEVAVHNGTVRNWAHGVRLGTSRNGQFRDLRLSGNSIYGLEAGGGSTIVNCTATNNNSGGIVADIGSQVRGCTATFNLSFGIFAKSGCVVSDCTARSNSGYGILADNQSSVSGCVASLNTVSGIFANTGSITVSGCTASNNTEAGIAVLDGSAVTGCSAYSNGTDGIRAESGNTITGCTVKNNGGDGIEVNDGCRVVENTCADNGAGIADGAGIHARSSRNRIESNNVNGNDRGIDCNPAVANLIIRNSARGNTTNYDLAAGNSSGGIISTAGANFSSTNPWANLDF